MLAVGFGPSSVGVGVLGPLSRCCQEDSRRKETLNSHHVLVRLYLIAECL